MVVKTIKAVSPTIKKRAKQLLAYAQEKARTCRYSNELFNAIFSPTGQAAVIFPDEAERGAFFRTKEYKDIRKLEGTLPRPPVEDVGDLLANAKLSINLQVPKSLHAALLAEAVEEGVTLDQLCLTKLAAQLRKVV